MSAKKTKDGTVLDGDKTINILCNGSDTQERISKTRELLIEDLIHNGNHTCAFSNLDVAIQIQTIEACGKSQRGLHEISNVYQGLFQRGESLDR